MSINWKSTNWDSLISGEQCPVCDLMRLEKQEDKHMIRICDLTISRLYLAKNQFVQGYCILIYNRHVIEPYELSTAERSSYFDDLAQTASVLRKVFNADKINYNILGNVVPHLHTHILPRYFIDNAPNRPIDPASSSVFLTVNEYDERIKLIFDHIEMARK
jgi:diadenosine tetraphosphate (Ap4A) HIT family hydrolase